MKIQFAILAGSLLLGASGIALAQSSGSAPATIVPAGQAAPGAGAAAAAPAAPAQAAPAAPAAGEGQGAPAAPAPDAQAAAPAAGGNGGTNMASGEKMKPDAHPSKDTQTEGNAATPGENGKFVDSAGNPSYNVSADGKVDWYTWRGYKKFMANCMQCHGPDGMGSSFAPNLTESLQSLNYFDFAGIIVSGQQNKWNSSGNSIMPAWGEDPNVMCSLDAIYVYLKARTDGVVARGEPKREGKNDAAQKAEYDCLGF